MYKSYDPRAQIIKKLADEVFSILGRDPLIEIAIELERIALSDKYFIERKLYPNVDFYSGLIYKAMGFPTDFFTVLFAIPRTAGWLAHWVEYLDDPENNVWFSTLGFLCRDYYYTDASWLRRSFGHAKSTWAKASARTRPSTAVSPPPSRTFRRRCRPRPSVALHPTRPRNRTVFVTEFRASVHK